MKTHYEFGHYRLWEWGCDLGVWGFAVFVRREYFCFFIGPFYISREEMPF